MKGGFIQAGHGKESAIRRFTAADEIICYSPRQTYGGKEPCQSFTAYGKIKDSELYQAKQSGDFKPFRRKVKYEHVIDAEIRPLIRRLSFIKNKTSWSARFRFGVFSIPEEDAEIIKAAMGVSKTE